MKVRINSNIVLFYVIYLTYFIYFIAVSILYPCLIRHSVLNCVTVVVFISYQSIYYFLIFFLLFFSFFFSSVRLGTIDQDEAEKEWVLRPYMNTARKKQSL